MSVVTRRQLLGGAIAAGGAVLASAAIGRAPRGMGNQPTDALYRVRGSGLSLASPTFRKGIQPLPGERILAHAELANDEGESLGVFYAVYMALAATSGTAASLEQHTFDFGDGTLVGSGLGTREFEKADTFAIVGGTGRYKGARGTYTANQHHLELGGDGTAEFVIALTA